MSDNDARIKALEKEVAELKTSISSFGKKPRRKNDDTKKTPTPYNLHLKKYMLEEKTKLGPDYDHKAAFSSAAKAWSAQKKAN